MKPKLITLTAACAMMLATISIAHAQDPASKDFSGNRPHHRWGNGLERMTETLDLTPEHAIHQAREDMTDRRDLRLGLFKDRANLRVTLSVDTGSLVDQLLC